MRLLETAIIVCVLVAKEHGPDLSPPPLIDAPEVGATFQATIERQRRFRFRQPSRSDAPIDEYFRQ